MKVIQIAFCLHFIVIFYLPPEQDDENSGFRKRIKKKIYLFFIYSRKKNWAEFMRLCWIVIKLTPCELIKSKLLAFLECH